MRLAEEQQDHAEAAENAHKGTVDDEGGDDVQRKR